MTAPTTAPRRTAVWIVLPIAVAFALLIVAWAATARSKLETSSGAATAAKSACPGQGAWWMLG